LYVDVLYERVAASHRVELHRRIAERQEAAYGERAREIAATLAHHYIRCGDSSKAVKYLRLAAEQAMSRSAYLEARNQLNRALELLGKRPADAERDQSEIAVRLDLAICMKFSGGLGTTANGENLERARDLCERTGDETSLSQVLDALADHYAQGDENQKIQAVGEELLRIATRTHRSEAEGRARFWLGGAASERGDFVTAAAESEQACQLPATEAPIRDPLGWDWRIRTRTLAARAWWTLGFPTRAQQRIVESVEIARSIKTPPSDLTLTLLWASGFYILLRDWKMALRYCDEARRIAHEHDMIDFSGFGRGLPLARLGQPEAGLAELLPFKNTLGALPFWRRGFFSTLAEIYLAMGRAQEGLEAVDQALEFTRDEFDAELCRLKGELLMLGEGCPSAEASQWFTDAIEGARRQSAKSWELRATTSLARLLEKMGRREQARTMLAEIYKWFTEGFDTPDLKEAKALLDKLGTPLADTKLHVS
jgi:tetratricopeptide (TPR) repeat protein